MAAGADASDQQLRQLPADQRKPPVCVSEPDCEGLHADTVPPGDGEGGYNMSLRDPMLYEQGTM